MKTHKPKFAIGNIIRGRNSKRFYRVADVFMTEYNDGLDDYCYKVEMLNENGQRTRAFVEIRNNGRNFVLIENQN